MFRIQIGSQTIGHFSEIDGLTVEYEVFEWQEGGENRFVHKLRGRAKYPNIVLKRGITHEAALLDWFRKCQTKTDRQEGHIDLLGRDGKPVRRFAFEGAFPVKWTGPKLNAASTSIATEQLEIAHTGWRPENAGG
jgi:phage tail-like protein